MTPVPHARSPTGFTLIEVLVALAVLGLVLGVLSAGIRFGLLADGRGTSLTDRTADFDVVDRTLRRVIEGMDPGDDADPAPFVGVGDRMECITTMPADGSAADRHMRASVLVDDTHRLILRWRPYLRARPLLRPPPPTTSELLSNVSRIDLAFWRPGVGWVSAWHSADLPTLVRVRLRFPAGDPRRWPDIVAAPRLDRP